jgi:hypothetical protein
MRDSSIRRRSIGGAGWMVAATLLLTLSLPPDANAMCCLCRDCSGAAYCVDGLANSLACSTFCFNNGCPSTVFDSVDTCAGGCDGAPDAPTATVSATPTETATATASATATSTSTASGVATSTATPTASPSDTPSATATSSATATVTDTPEGSATPTATPSVTPTVTGQLAGHIRYYAGSHPPVEGVDVSLLGTPPDATMTDSDGDYSFGSSAMGDFTIQPAKDDTFNTAITSLDAVVVLQFVSGGFGVVLTPDQELAADVSGNGSVSTLDAAYILQFQASIIDRLPIAEQCQSDWLFVPEASPTPGQTLIQPVLSGEMCTEKGAIQFDDFTPPLAGRDFRAILIGDVTGNWAPLTPTPIP